MFGRKCTVVEWNVTEERLEKTAKLYEDWEESWVKRTYMNFNFI